MGALLEDQLKWMRDHGWKVAVHNDYSVNFVSYTFWLFTHFSGVWVRGEATTDSEALRQIIHQVETRYPDLTA